MSVKSNKSFSSRFLSDFNDEKVFKDFRKKTLDHRRVTKAKNNGLEQGFIADNDGESE